MVNGLIAHIKMSYYAEMASLKAASVIKRWEMAEFTAPEGLVAIAGYESFEGAGDAGLAILAMGYPYWIFIDQGFYILCVEVLQLELVQCELAALDDLNHQSPIVQRVHYLDFRVRSLAFLCCSVLLSLIFVAQSKFELVAQGRVDARLMMEHGQWWRALTGLTLHSNLVHLVSNLVAGLGFAFFVARFFGSAAGWLLILLSGFAGNVLNAWIHYPAAHLSIGASTAVFAALGLLAGVGVWLAWLDPRSVLGLPPWLIPFFAALTLLGLLGMGDAITVDVAAHLSGFVCGLLMGVVAAFFQPAWQRLQVYSIVLGLMTLFCVAAAWCFSLL